MDEFIETICLENGKAQHLPLHVARMERTARDHGFLCPLIPDVEQLCPDALKRGRVKCRFVYRSEIADLSYSAYTSRLILSFSPVYLPEGYTYRYKKRDRAVLDYLRQICGADEPLLINGEGRLTDCSFANLALLRDGIWYTPDTPLLDGVQRQFLIQQQKLVPRAITLEDLPLYSQIRPINAMLPLESVAEGGASV